MLCTILYLTFLIFWKAEVRLRSESKKREVRKKEEMKWDCTDIVKGALHWWALFSLWKHIYNDFCGSDINIDHFRILILIIFKTVLQAIWKTPFTCIMGNVAPSVFGVERDWMFYSAAVILSILSLIHHFWVPQHYGSAIFIFCSTLRMETPQIYLKKKKRIKFLYQYCLGFFFDISFIVKYWIVSCGRPLKIRRMQLVTRGHE